MAAHARCASITGAYVALSLAFRKLAANKVIAPVPLLGQVAAVSCGLVNGVALLDLDYQEDSGAEADANFVLTPVRRHRGNPGHRGTIPVQRGAVWRAYASGQTRHDASVRGPTRGAGVMARRLEAGSRLVLASHNKGKLAEMCELMGALRDRACVRGRTRFGGAGGDRARFLWECSAEGGSGCQRVRLAEPGR